MADTCLLTLSALSSVCGMAWLALAMKPHWLQVQAQVPHRDSRALKLRVAGSCALALSLVACVAASHASLAVLVWVMNLTGGALLVALLLAYRAHWLAWFVGAAPSAPSKR